ncbi:MAG: polysaccharide deacetylase family protein [Xanthobacteraceae bacterium]|nr:polysaccharide deacetylase family protein [Xanthobacteraceae bacterium]
MRSTIIRTGFDTLYLTRLHRLLGRFFGGIGAILMLHHVRPPRHGAFAPNQGLEVAPWFLLHTVEWLRREEIDIVSLDEMHRRLIERDFARRFACLTFDDGYRDNKQWAYPILAEHRAPFAIYIPTSFPDRRGKLWWLALETVIAQNDGIIATIDGREQRYACATTAQKRATFDAIYWWLRSLAREADIHAFVEALSARYGIDMAPVADALCMTWDEIRELAADPLVTIGAHTVNHIMLGKADEATARAELATSREVIAAALERPVLHFAYPYGGPDLVGKREFRLAAEVGFATGVTTRPGVLFPEHAAHPMALPRLSLNGEYQEARYLEVLMSGTATALFNGFRRVKAA